MRTVGEAAPDFTFSEQGRRPTLRECLAAGPVVLYFYPADFTPVCTKEACMFRDLHGELVGAGVKVLGVSPQNDTSHDAFRARHRIPFTLIADPKREIIRAYGVGGMFGLPLPFGARRVTYLIGTDGRIADRATGEFGISAHARFVSRVLENRASTITDATASADSTPNGGPA